MLAIAVPLGAAAPLWQRALPANLPTLATLPEPAVPPGSETTPARVELGRRLFYDADLSADGTMACATCHEQKHAFADGNRTHPGVTGEPGRRNVPGLANVGWMSPLTLADPAITTLEAQVATPLLGTHPVEMGMAGRAAAIAGRLGRDSCYRTMFARAFPQTGGAIDLANVARALASFERRLASFDSAYDRGALPEPARAGSALFARACASCHAGPLFTDLKAHRLGPVDRAADDQGLFEKTGSEDDRGRFRTPSLRNVALTGPWWHDGSAPGLDAAIARHGKAYGPAELASLTAFLAALSDPGFTTRKDLALPDRACGKRL